jgi:hypothetical protein
MRVVVLERPACVRWLVCFCADFLTRYFRLFQHNRPKADMTAGPPPMSVVGRIADMEWGGSGLPVLTLAV